MENEQNQITFFAETDFRNQKRRFGIKQDDRRRHTYVIGKTGTGKTTLLENMAIQDIQRGNGIAIVDPHGEFADKMIDFIPANRINDVVFFNPADLDNPIAFNVMEKVDAEHRHLIASGLVGVFKKIWAESWGPRLEYVLRNAVLALLEYPGSTLLGIMRLLVDKEYRAKVMEKVKDPVVRSFWVDEFSKYKGNFEVEAISPIQNKVGQFLTNPLIRNIVGQTKSTIDMREIMDQQKILIINLSKGLIGEDASALLGAMLITKIQLAAMSRVNISEKERKDFYLYVDEFQNFATDSFANILSEARKYRLNLVLAHQYVGQLITDSSTRVKDAVFGNVGTMIIFRVGAEDAEFLEKEFEPEFMINDLVGLGFAQIYLKLMIDGFASRPFSAITLPPIQREEKSYREKIIKVSRERYGGLPRVEVEEKIARWSGMMEEAAEDARESKNNRNDRNDRNSRNATNDRNDRNDRNSRNDRNDTNDRIDRKNQISNRPALADNRRDFAPEQPVFIDKCFNCGQKIELHFKPDGVRPVYCKDCLVKVRADEGQKPVRRPTAGEISVRETGQPISLSEATGRGSADNFKSAKKPRREPDLSELRSVLNEVVGPLERSVERIEKSVEKPVKPPVVPPVVPKPPVVPSVPKPQIPSAPKMAEKQIVDGEIKGLKPGEPVEL